MGPLLVPSHQSYRRPPMIEAAVLQRDQDPSLGHYLKEWLNHAGADPFWPAHWWRRTFCPWRFEHVRVVDAPPTGPLLRFTDRDPRDMVPVRRPMVRKRADGCRRRIHQARSWSPACTTWAIAAARLT